MHTLSLSYHKGTLRVEGICATGINASVAQELEQTDVVIAVDLMGTAEHRMSKNTTPEHYTRK